MKRWILLAALAGLVGHGAAAAADAGVASDGDFPPKASPEAMVYRGNIVYSNYCVLCHGVKADGMGRAAKIYNPKPSNLAMSDKNAQYKELIIRQGGAALARSKFMPPWNDELTNEQVSDVVGFLESLKSTAR